MQNETAKIEEIFEQLDAVKMNPGNKLGLAQKDAFRAGLFARIFRPLIASAFCFRILFLLFVPVFCSRISPR